MEKYIKNKLVSKLPNLKRWYGRYDFRSWIVLGANLYRQKISLRKMREGLELYKHLTRSQKYFISLPRSGSSYIVSILNSATDISSGGTGKYFLDEETDLWTHNLRLHYPVAPNTFLKILNRYYSSPPHQNTFAVSHHPITHGFIDPHKMKVVFTLRNLHDQLKSLLYHQGFDFETQDKFIEKGYVEMMIDYFNYWGEFIKSKDKKFNRDFFLL